MRPQAPLHREDRMVDARGLRFHIREWRQASPTPHAPILLIHGLASAGAIWELVAPLLAGTGRRVVALDQRGHGESDKPASGYEFASIVADDVAIMDALGLERAVVAGHSWGGGVALNLAAARPDRVAALVLVDGGFTQLSRRAWTHDEAIAALTPPRFAGTPTGEFLARVQQGPLGAQWDDELTGIMLRIVQSQSDGTVAPRLAFENHMQIVEALWQDQTLAHYDQVQCPVLLIAPELDAQPDFARQKRDAIAEIQAAHPNVRAEFVPDTIHDIPLQRPQLLADLILSVAL